MVAFSAIWEVVNGELRSKSSIFTVGDSPRSSALKALRTNELMAVKWVPIHNPQRNVMIDAINLVEMSFISYAIEAVHGVRPSHSTNRPLVFDRFRLRHIDNSYRCPDAYRV
jgi:hypothetical protein